MKPGDPRLVENLFDEAAPTYDYLNDLLSLGLHRTWKKQLLNWVDPKSGENWIDLCCGTGDMAIKLAKFVSPGGKVLGLDSAEVPLSLAKERVIKEDCDSISWMKADALATGLPSSEFDGCVMAYGLRNVANPYEALVEIRRILKPNARAGLLDFNHLDEGTFGHAFQTFYLRNVVVPIASRLGLREHYTYLEESIKNFPTGHEQVEIASEAGFSKVRYQSIAFGLMGVLLIGC